MCNWRNFLNLLLLLSLDVRAHEIDQLTVIRGSGPKQLQIRGEPGRVYAIQGASDLTPADDWQVLQQFTLPQTVFEWIDPASAAMPRRFYRLIKMPPSNQPFTATNFRLLDQQGKTRELQYYSNQQAIVLIFADSNCTGVEQSVPTLKALRDQYSNQSVLFWLIMPDGQITRTEVADRASALGIDWPILQDAAQLVTRDLNAHHSLEAICLNAADRTVFYRGAIHNRADPNSTPSQNYLADALGTFLAGKTVAPLQKEFNGCELSLIPTKPISYAADIAPILQKNCVSCHSAGNIAPWEMKNYEVVKNFAPLIKEKVMTGEMPPWHADPAYGTFGNDASLKPEEASALVQWINAGAPRGDGPDPLADLFASQPPPADYPQTWPVELGEPDFVVSIPKFTAPASGEVGYKYPSVQVKISSNVWLRAAVVLPGNTRIVHHSLVFIGKGFDILLQGAGLAGFFAGYVPGMKPTEFPAGTAKLLPANSTITFQMHYTTVGAPETDQTRLGLYFAAEPPKAELITSAIYNVDFIRGDLVIPPNAADVPQEAISPALEHDILLYELSPHMHYRGSRFKYEALYPDGSTEVLLSVPKYDFHWQTLYRFTQPKRLPAGTRIRGLGAFDNSAQNRDNPNPGVTVRFGEQTDDEMFIGYLNYSEVPN
jgi:hypothetical protein